MGAWYSMEKIHFAIIIPAYNEQATIVDLVQRCLQLTPNVIVVNDASVDETAAVLAPLPITLLNQPYNQGKAAALWRGFLYASELGVSQIITLDGDGQHAPEDVPRLQAAFQPNSIVIGSRLQSKHDIPVLRYLANRFANFWIAWAAGYPIIDSQSGFRIYPPTICQLAQEPAKNRETGFVFESAVLIAAGQAGLAIIPVAIPALYAKNARPSHFRPVRDILQITKMVAGQLLGRGLALPSLWRSLRSR